MGRLNKELKRCGVIAGAVPNRVSLFRLFGARVTEQRAGVT